MAVEQPAERPAWTVAETKARLSEILRLAEVEGPQRIGRRNPFVVVPERLWQEREAPQRKPLGRWLVENMPGGADFEPPDRLAESHREIPFADWSDEDWGDGGE